MSSRRARELLRHARPFPCQDRVGRKWLDFPYAANLWPYMWPADRPDLSAGDLGERLPGRRQADAGRRCPISSNGRPTRWPATPSRAPPLPAFLLAPVDAGRRLQCRAAGAARLQPAARRAVRPRRPVCGAPARLPHLRPHARAVAALPSGAAHRRPVAHHRARHQGHRDDRALHHAQHRADHPRIRADRRHLRLHLSAGAMSSWSRSRSGSMSGSRSGPATGASPSAAT